MKSLKISSFNKSNIKINSYRKNTNPNTNSKSYFSNNLILDTNNSKSKEKKINSSRKKYKTSAHSKEKSTSKNKDELLSSRIIKNNIKFPNNNNNNSNVNKKINIEIYEKIIDNLFLYLKKILPNEIYKDIKNFFILNLNQEIKNFYFFKNFDSNFKSSISNQIKESISKSFSNEVEFIDNNNTLKNNKNKQGSLYTLSKSKIVTNLNSSKSRSPTEKNNNNNNKNKKNVKKK